MRRQARVRAPELSGRGGWIGTDRPLTLADLRGRFVLLEFWTSCCVNCLHVLAELRTLETQFSQELVVIGVHSPKFAYEQEHASVVDAVARHGVTHPVLDDPDLTTWGQYAVRAWPTLVLVDPEGYVVHAVSGEGHGSELAILLADLVVEYDVRGTLHRADPPRPARLAGSGPLSFPGKALRLPDGAVMVSDTAHHSLVIVEDGVVRRRIGSGVRGRDDGPAPTFAEPQGLCLLPDGTVVVADSANHLLRQVDVTSGTVTTVAGTGSVGRPNGDTPGPALSVDLSTPWDVALWQGEVVVAMAGDHQLWAWDGRRVRVLAGTAGEGLRDGPAAGAYLAQPSGLAAGPDRLWFVDAESSALRWYRDGWVGTAIGTGLFDFGYRDGPAAMALFQHPLGVTVVPDGGVIVLDTFNGAVRRYDPERGTVSTVTRDLLAPSGAVLEGGDLLVVESAGHRLTRVRLDGPELLVVPEPGTGVCLPAAEDVGRAG